MPGFANFSKMAFKSAIGVLIFSLPMLMTFNVVCLNTMASAEENMALSPEEKDALVTEGISQYQGGNLKVAKESFERAKSASSDSADVPYYLGMIYLEENQRSSAITEWQQYVRMSPDSQDAAKIRKYLTLLLRQEAVAYAKAAVANEATLLSGPVTDNTLAVTSFGNIGSKALAPLGKGMAAMLIGDLSQVPDLQVVERVRLQALLQEMNLGTSGIVNPETVPKVGKLLKSKHVATGSLADSTKESLQIVSAVVDTEQADHIDTREADGALKEFFNLEKQIACGIIEDIGRACKEMPEAFNKIHTKSLAALTSYSIGLDYLDQEKYDQAREQFQKAVEEDPDFDLAKESLAWTPLSAMMFMGSSQMVSSLSTGVVSSTGTAAGGGGISTGWMIAGGIAGAAAVAAAAGGGGGGDGGSDDGGNEPAPPTADVDLTGDWVGTWTNSGNTIGNVSFSLTQTGTSVSGTTTITGSGCTLNGNISGTIEGSSFQATITGSGSASYNATCTATSMNGDLNVTSGSCGDLSGAVTATITGGATVSW